MRIETTKSASFSLLLREAGEPTRLRILDLLKLRALCVAELQYLLHLPESMVSRHLARLRYANLVEVEGAGQRRVYRLMNARTPAALVLRRFLTEIGKKESGLARDAARLRHWVSQQTGLPPPRAHKVPIRPEVRNLG